MSSSNSETKTRILEVSLQILEERGGRGVRMADIAKRASISRQAAYLHFPSRAELLIATTRFLDEKLDLETRLAPSRTALSGEERLSVYIDFWGHYLPEIYSVAKALLLLKESDEAAAAAWQDRMAAMRDGCRAAVNALEADNNLATEWQRDEAVDTLWTLLSVENWEKLTFECAWSQQQYIERMTGLAKRILVKETN